MNGVLFDKTQVAVAAMISGDVGTNGGTGNSGSMYGPGGIGGGGVSGPGGSFSTDGGRGGSIIGLSAIAILTEVSGVNSPDDSNNG